MSTPPPDVVMCPVGYSCSKLLTVPEFVLVIGALVLGFVVLMAAVSWLDR